MPTPDRPRSFLLRLDDEAATARLGAALAGVLHPGDAVLLSGALGAGKSALARAVIGALLGDPGAEIPSPSYTLVNVYETPRGPVWHADLYRLSGDAAEIGELGLDEAMDPSAEGAAGGALVLVEWPERLGGALPARRLEIRLSSRAGAEGRDAMLTLAGPGWEAAAAMLAAWA
jgi:tRNA threonylcarbamoyladenosine biosynthesis protein TsaE